MKPLRILYVVTSFPSTTETFIATQIADMLDRGHDCTIFAYNPSNDNIRHQLISDYKLEQKTITHFKNADSRWGMVKGLLRFFKTYATQINYNLFFSLFNPFTFQAKAAHRKLYWDLPVFLLQKKYDVIHCHFGFNGVKVARLKKAGILTNERCIVSFHGSDLTPSKVTDYKLLYYDLFSYFDAFTVNTPYLKEILAQVAPNLKDIYVIPVGFHENYLKPYLNLPKNELFTIVFCGRFMALKGPDKALTILTELVQQGIDAIQLVMIGEGEELSNLKKQAKELGIEKHLKWMGALTQEAVFTQMSKAHVFLYPGRTEPETGRAETQGLVIQEAQYLKLPVVVADVGGVSYGLQDTVTGFSVAEDNLDLFVEKILFLYRYPDLSDRMGIKGHKLAKSIYECKILGEMFVDFYTNLNRKLF
jgi:colanic acid/amylovoran biosynthesis glycosyltransferase